MEHRKRSYPLAAFSFLFALGIFFTSIIAREIDGGSGPRSSLDASFWLLVSIFALFNLRTARGIILASIGLTILGILYVLYVGFSGQALTHRGWQPVAPGNTEAAFWIMALLLVVKLLAYKFSGDSGKSTTSVESKASESYSMNSTETVPDVRGEIMKKTEQSAPRSDQTSREPEKSEWSNVIEYFPEVNALYERLRELDPDRAAKFRSDRLTLKDFKHPRKAYDATINAIVEEIGSGNYWEAGEFLRTLINEGQLGAARKFILLCKTLGPNNIDRAVVARFKSSLN